MAWQPVHLGLHDLASRTTTHGFDVLRCGCCGVGRTWPLPDDTREVYPDSYLVHGDIADRTSPAWRARYGVFAVARQLVDVPLTRSIVRRALMRYGGETWHELSRYGHRGRFRLLDVGCGSGAFARNLRRLGIDARGVEPSADAADAARRAGVPCTVGTIHSLDAPAGIYDVVRFGHVLEHTEDPVAELRQAHRLLGRDGRVVVRVPAWDSLQAELFGRSWRPLDIPRHLWHFTRSSLQRALTSAGFSEASWQGAFQDFVPASFLFELIEAGIDQDAAIALLTRERTALRRLRDEFARHNDITEWFVIATADGDDRGRAAARPYHP